MKVAGLLLAALLAECSVRVVTQEPSLPTALSVSDDSFQLNGRRIVIRSGSMHYHRVHQAYWADRIARLKALGLNTVQTYVPWNHHERIRGTYDFTPGTDRDLAGFLQLVHAAGMMVMLRPGPYICGEHDGGGFPAYLLANAETGQQLRTNGSAYLAAVDAWWAVLLPYVKPHLYSGGSGPVVAVQIENEFGSYGSTSTNPADAAYMRHLKDAAAAALGGPEAVLLYTTDGGDVSYMENGALPGEMFATPDFGPTLNTSMSFGAQDLFNPPGQRAHIDSEYYPGWLTHWGTSMANVSSIDSAAGITVLLAQRASVNLYMAHGGTNWGFANGANGGGVDFQPVITSYDYNGPVSEGGEHGVGSDGVDKYQALRQVYSFWSAIYGDPQPPAEPPLPRRAAYGWLSLNQVLPVLPNANTLSPTPVYGAATFGAAETYNQSAGYILYRCPSLPAALVPADGRPAVLQVQGLADRLSVFVNSAPWGVLYRPDGPLLNLTIPAGVLTAGATLDLLVGNMGHLNYGRGIYDPKGLPGGPDSVTLNGTSLAACGSWDVFPLPMDYSSISGVSVGGGDKGRAGASETVQWTTLSSAGAPSALSLRGGGSTTAPPQPTIIGAATFFRGTFNIPTGGVADTWLASCGWTKGFAFVNGVNIGRYWEAQGPQHALFVPAPLLQEGANEVIMYEEENPAPGYNLRFVDGPDWTGAVCKSDAGDGGEVSPVAEGQAERSGANVKTPRAGLDDAADSADSACKAPVGGMQLTLQNCTNAAAAQFVWTETVSAAAAGVLALAAEPHLCVGAGAPSPSAAAPPLLLVACNGSDLSQQFIRFQRPQQSGSQAGGPVMAVLTGLLWDVAGQQPAMGAALELQANDGTRLAQQWAFAVAQTTAQAAGADTYGDGSTSGQGGQTVTLRNIAAPGMCIAAC